ncbi:unnamed protein product [Lactuca virosa]|uniref:Uncharacterized protein n=1 Tax=Lactuca virosa TaxID=75947 RepID=A0AAU9P6D7_9ASTR|nr:unnamed protein product [Lactuca virosa]
MIYYYTETRELLNLEDSSLYDAVNEGADVLDQRQPLQIVSQLGEEVLHTSSLVRKAFTEASAGSASKKFKDPSHISGIAEAVEEGV